MTRGAGRPWQDASDLSPKRRPSRNPRVVFVHEPETNTYRCPAGAHIQKRFARVEGGKLIGVYFNQKACGACVSRPLCTAGKEKRIRRWEHEAVLDAMDRRLQAMPEAMAVRRCTVEHVFGTIKGWMGATHFRTRGLKNVSTETSLSILAYNIKHNRRRRRRLDLKAITG